MDAEPNTLSKLGRDFDLPRQEVATLAIAHGIPTYRLLNGVVVPDAHMETFGRILRDYAEERSRRRQLTQTP